MIVELIYTSAPDTLDGPGYGVVAKTEGLSGRLEKFLRQLNRYDFELSAGGDQGHDGPVVFSHTTTRDGSEAWHVLSRVGFGGYDYSHRAVFLAHHVAIRDDDLRGVRAVDLLLSPSLFVTRWDGPIGLRSRRPVPAPARSDRGRELWKGVAGHPDWARAWVDLWTQQEGQPCFLITPPGADVLGLFAGASSLLAAEQADRIGILTHMDTDRAGVSFDWIGLTAGGKLARSIVGRFPDRSMDLSRPLAGSPPPAIASRPSTTIAPLRPAERPWTSVAALADDHDPGEYWTESPTVPVASRHSRSRSLPAPAASPPPPPPPELFAGGWTRPLMACGAVVLVAALCGSSFWFGRNGRIMPKAPPGIATNAPTVGTRPTTSDSIASAPKPKPAPSGNQAAPDAGNQTGPRAPKAPEIVVQIRATQDVHKPQPRRMVRPIGRWPLQALIRPDAGFVKVVELDGAGYSQLQLLTPDGSGLKVDKIGEDEGRPSIEVLCQVAPDPEERIKLRLTPPTIATPPATATHEATQAPSSPLVNPAVIEVKLVSKSADSLLKWLQLSLLRVKSSAVLGSDLDKSVDVSFVPILPEIPLAGPWDYGDKSMKQGADGFFLAVFDATHRLVNPVEAEFRLKGVSLSILPAGGAGWSMGPPKTAETWVPDQEKALTVGFEVARRDGKPGGPWPFTLELTTNFNRTQAGPTEPAVELSVSREMKPPEAPDPTKPSDASPAVKPDQGTFPAEKPTDQNPNPQAGNPKAKSKARRKAAPPPKPAPIQDGELVLEMLQRYGRASGSIVIPIKLWTPDDIKFGSPEPTERIEILIFEAAPPASTK